jgi:hypothetical protein
VKNKVLISVIVLASGGAVVALVHGVRSSMQHPYAKVSYPYVCQGCGVVFDVRELKKSPDLWRIPPKAPSDSVVICIKCNKGWAYPVTKCDVCGTEYILYLCRDRRCPKCFPQAAEVAKKAGVNVFFKRPD